MCSHLVSASSSQSQPETLIPQMMAQHSKLSSTTTGLSGLQALQTLASFYPQNTHMEAHTPPPPPPQPLPPACAILPTATLGKIIRWLADILSIFLSWLRVRLAGCLLIDVLTEFFFFFFPEELCPSLPDCERASRGKCTGRREGLTNAKQFIKIRHKASIRGEGCC